MKTIEKWARIDFHDAWYEVSNTGRVRTIAAEPRYLVPKLNPVGAPTVRIRYKTPEGAKAMAFLSLPKLVADTFPDLVPNPNRLPLLGYKDGDERNCAVDNLYWRDYVRRQATSPRSIKKAIKDAARVADQQHFWNSMSYEEQQDMLKLGQPEKGVVLKERPTAPETDAN